MTSSSDVGEKSSYHSPTAKNDSRHGRADELVTDVLQGRGRSFRGDGHGEHDPRRPLGSGDATGCASGRTSGDPVVDDHGTASSEIDRRSRVPVSPGPTNEFRAFPSPPPRQGRRRRSSSSPCRPHSRLAPRSRRWPPSPVRAETGSRACARRSRRVEPRVHAQPPRQRGPRPEGGRARRHRPHRRRRPAPLRPGGDPHPHDRGTCASPP